MYFLDCIFSKDLTHKVASLGSLYDVLYNANANLYVPHSSTIWMFYMWEWFLDTGWFHGLSQFLVFCTPLDLDGAMPVNYLSSLDWKSFGNNCICLQLQEPRSVILKPWGLQQRKGCWIQAIGDYPAKTLYNSGPIRWEVFGRGPRKHRIQRRNL